MGENLKSIHHIGSTSIAGLLAKPIIDILLVIKSIRVLDTESGKLTAAGYEAKGENGIIDRRYFQKNEAGERAYHVHAFEEQHPKIVDFLLFRNYLREFPTRAKEYENLKLQLAQKFSSNKIEYTKGKGPLIDRLISEAKARAKESGQNPINFA